MRALWVLPSVWPPYTERCMAGLAPELAERVLVLDNSERNRGVAASWNIGAQRVLSEGLDWLVSLSAATRFGSARGRDFAEALAAEPADAWVLEASAPVGWHLIGWSRAFLAGVGLFDENFWPAYGEDADIAYRFSLLRDRHPDLYWDNQPMDAWITMRGHGTELAGVDPHIDASIAYFDGKWGPGAWASPEERWPQPFGSESLDFWPRPPDPRAVFHDGWLTAEEAA